MPEDITKRSDVELLVNEFYHLVREDDLIGNIFNQTMGDQWPVHLSKMYRFWETVLLNSSTYSGAPFMPHAKLPLEQKHFDRWLLLFDLTIDRYFEGPTAQDAKARAAKMAVMFLSKIEYLRHHGSFKPLI